MYYKFCLFVNAYLLCDSSLSKLSPFQQLPPNRKLRPISDKDPSVSGLFGREAKVKTTITLNILILQTTKIVVTLHP